MTTLITSSRPSSKSLKRPSLRRPTGQRYALQRTLRHRKLKMHRLDHYPHILHQYKFHSSCLSSDGPSESQLTYFLSCLVGKAFWRLWQQQMRTRAHLSDPINNSFEPGQI